MSTRANIVIKEGTQKLFFYRHSDGYPEGTLPTLRIFHKWMIEDKIRNDIQQGSGWLILLGAMEYATIPEFKKDKTKYGFEVDVNTISDPNDWKVGAYEPTTNIHGDIEYLYVIDMRTKTIECYEDWTSGGEGKGMPIETISNPSTITK